MAGFGEAVEFVKEHPKGLAAAGTLVVALAIAGDMSSDYDRQVVDPLQDKMTCVVDYLEITGQSVESEVVVDVPAQPVPEDGSDEDCLESIEDLLVHDYEGQGEDDGTLATVQGRPDLSVHTVPELTWADIQADVADRLDAAQDAKTGHVARKFGGLILKGAILTAAAVGTVSMVKGASKNVKQSFEISRESRRKNKAALSRPTTIRSAPSIDRAVEDTGDLSDVEVPASTSDDVSGTLADAEDLRASTEDYIRNLGGRPPTGGGRFRPGQAEAEEAEQQTRRLAAQLQAKQAENEAITGAGNPSLPEPQGFFARRRKRSPQP